MKQRSYIIALFFAFAILLLFSTKELPTKNDLIREEVATKMDKYRKNEVKKCTKKVMELAGTLVDSTLIARARLQVKEIIEKPDIPFRPDRPDVKLPKDTTPVEPIFSKEEVEQIEQ